MAKIDMAPTAGSVCRCINCS